jgi:hypothetical protein
LSLFTQLGISLKTSNCIESVMSMVARYTTDKFDCWKNASQKHRETQMDCLSPTWNTASFTSNQGVSISTLINKACFEAAFTDYHGSSMMKLCHFNIFN